jgi:hypothetical protein
MSALLALFIRSIKQKEKKILEHLDKPTDGNDSLNSLRIQLQQLRTNRKNPPKLIFSDQHTRYSHA